MADRRAQPWQTLSGVERQRVHMARAFAQSPRVMCLDEPTNHIDIHHQIEILRKVRRMDMTTVIALHDLNLAAMFCDWIIVLQDGTAIACGPPADLLSQSLLDGVFLGESGCGLLSATGAPHIRFGVA